MSSPIRHSQAMPQAQVRFKKRFTELMTQTAQRISSLVLRAADDDGVIPIEDSTSLITQSLRLIDQLFVSSDGRTAVRKDGMPLSPYAKVLLEEIGRVTYDTVEAHSKFLKATLPGDVRRWLDTSSRRLSEIALTPPLPLTPSPLASARSSHDYREGELLTELMTLDEIKRRFPSLTDADARAVRDLRLFEPNPLAEYEAAHTWVDERGYRLSDRIWRTNQETRRKLNDLMQDLIASGTSARDIARLVEQFLIPGRELLRTNRPYGTDGSFDAMRLARTEIAHAANQAAYMAAMTNPYVTGIDVVRSANGDATCPICPQHATIGFSGERLRPPYGMGGASIPPYHPHDMCYVISVVMDTDVVTERLRRMLEISREVNLAPVMTPAQIDGFMQDLLGSVLWNITKQILPVQVPLF